MVRYHIFVEGRVQGVGFRYFVSMHAQSYGLTGSVKNLDNDFDETTITFDDCRKKLIDGITFSLYIDFYQAII